MCSMLETFHKLQGLHTDIVFLHVGVGHEGPLAVSSYADRTVFTLEIWHHLKIRKVFLGYSSPLWISVSLTCPTLLWKSVCIFSLYPHH